MSKSNTTVVEQEIGSEVAISSTEYQKNHEAMVQLNKQFAEIMRKYGAVHLVFQLNNIDAPMMEGITNIAKTVSATQDEEVWMELIFYRDGKHKDEVGAKMQNDKSMYKSMYSLYQQSLALLTPGTGFVMGEFNRLKI